MSQLKTWYASGGAKSLVSILEIKRDSAQSMYLYAGFEDIEITLENGEQVIAEASPIEIALRDKNNSGNQSITFGFENVSSLVLDYINAALDDDEEIRIIYRQYLSDDLSKPSDTPIYMTAQDASIEGAIVKIKSGHFDVINTGFNRTNYTASKYPGIKYL